jgi:hypothetical protein
MTTIILNKFYFSKRGFKIIFEDFNEINSHDQFYSIIYDIYIEIDNHKIKIPFYFEDGVNSIPSSTTFYDENNIEKTEIIWWNHKSNGKRMIRFGVDDNDYEINEFINLKSFKIGPNLNIFEDSIKFHCNCVQEFDVSFELMSSGISKVLIDIFNDTYIKETLHYDSLNKLNDTK